MPLHEFQLKKGLTHPTFDDETYTYDSVGNRLTSASTTGNWTYNQNNELGGYNDITYEYDANGNTTGKRANGQLVNQYIYNQEDRLIRVEDGSSTVIAEYYYDPFGRRLWKEVSGTRTYFLYSDEGLVGEYDSSGAEIRAYGYKPGSTWTTDPLFSKENGNYYFYHNDHLGTPQKITSTNGAIAWAGTYSSFGEATVDASSTITNNLRFAGQYYDNETGLHYNYHRYYDPQTGRYFRADPIGLQGGVNLYAYVENNPLLKIDPLGLKTIDGMDCTELSRKQIPTLSSGEPFASVVAGTRVICTDIDISDSLTCVCYGRREKIIEEYYDKYISWEVEYKCCTKTCPKKCTKRIKIESEKSGVGVRTKYESLPGVVRRLGTTGGAFSYCSKCLAGVGKPM